ncbi:hypothetical protein P152DRAFT_450528 [Eremomyces bilateralis CBS 781.70]|uniref:Ubiquitin 3 binding protein But2 C-terminal domain-containing protein n=1 Tax=Eremomyces bilateralis CBS 781.70 TaxID=1392243 RepID=A0A6G1FYK4_9PEZI|nr:uncharacterized protein P152DRAFT_450528 [Eremomyces bilateralis CBS 781.70]KAF1810927.1 hypothetical protein P152DRAFT_450528 [Eremomyces bilateralis CBS 781.70]
MYLSAVAFLFTASALLASAAPTPTENLQPRACTTIYPDIARVEEARPVESYLPGFIASQSEGNTNNKDAFAEFTVPDGHWGCTLQAYWPQNYPIQRTGNDLVYVYSVQAPLSRSPRGIDISWAYSPVPGAHIGTVRFQSASWGPSTQWINSVTCAPKLAFRFAIGETGAGSIEFNQQAGVAGLRLTYDC